VTQIAAGKLRHLIYIALLILLPLEQTALALADFFGPVVSVLDGDTLEVLNGHHTKRIRLSGIDCPEKGQWLRELGQEEGKL